MSFFNPYFFFTPGGKVEVDEAHETALARELEEELKVRLKSMTPYLVYKTQNEATGKEQLVHCYLADVEGELESDQEITGFGWFSKKEIPPVAKGIEQNLIPKLLQYSLL